VKLAAALRPHVDMAMMEPEVREKVEENADGHS